MKKAVFVLLVVTASLSYAQSGSNNTCAPSNISASDPAKVLADADTAFCNATQARRVDGWMEFMADNVVLDRATPGVGKDAVRAAISPQWNDPTFKLTWTPTRAELLGDGSMGYTTGRWRRELTKDGKAVTMTGNYLTVWRKQKDGSWKVIWDGGAADASKQGEKQ